MDIESIHITPIQKMDTYDNNNKIYIKRDDLFPVSFGGNKTRKAVLFFKDLEKKNCDCILTYGSNTSNHCLIIANIAASKGLPCYIISPTETQEITLNNILIKNFGAKIIQCALNDVSATIDYKLKELHERGYNPYFIQGGGHGNLGTRAYVHAYDEIIGFERETGINFDYIFHASGTGTTQAGLICGQMIHKKGTKIIGISIARTNPYGKDVIIKSVKSYLETLGNEQLHEGSVNFIDDYVLDGYGSYNNQIIQSINDVLLKNGIPMDTTYTGKAFWGMKDYIQKYQIYNKNILFIHTGGSPLFYDSLIRGRLL